MARWSVLLGLCALLAVGVAPGVAAAAGDAVRVPVVGQASVPAFDHIAILLLENHGAPAIIGNPAAPYINSLAQRYSLLDRYYAVSHPSLPNYLALVGGDTFGITDDCTSCSVNERNVADLLAGAGLTGKAYMEDMPSACFGGASSAGYAKKHDPFMYFNDIRGTAARCQAVVPYSELAADLQSPALPNYIWITPNMCHDMHDCNVATGDRWLQENVPLILNSPAFTQQRSLLAITWDEDGGADNRVPLILAGPQVKSGYVSHAQASHYSLLKTVEAAWGLPTLTANDATAQPITDVFLP